MIISLLAPGAARASTWSDAANWDAVTVNGGTLTVNNVGGDPALGAKFTLFSAADRVGNFTSIALPPLGVNKGWITNLTVDGSIQVGYTGSTTPPVLGHAVSGTNLVISWPTDHIGWRLLVQTNKLAIGISTNPADWTAVAGSVATNQVSVPLDPTKPGDYYRLVYP